MIFSLTEKRTNTDKTRVHLTWQITPIRVYCIA